MTPQKMPALRVALAFLCCSCSAVFAEPITALVYVLKKHEHYDNKLRNEVSVKHMDSSEKADFTKANGYSNDRYVEWVTLKAKGQVVTVVEFTFKSKDWKGVERHFTTMKSFVTDSVASLDLRIQQTMSAEKHYLSYRVVLPDAEIRKLSPN